jgi:high-affinity nickel-transport protein
LVASLDFGVLGYLIVGLFVLAWGVSAALWKLGAVEDRYGWRFVAHTHTHEHEGGLRHSHPHSHLHE